MIALGVNFRAGLARRDFRLDIAIQGLNDAAHAGDDRRLRRRRDDARRGDAARPQAVFEMHPHGSIGDRHIAIHRRHDQNGAAEDQHDDQHAESEREDVVCAVRGGRDVKEENEVDAHLRDG